MAGIGLTTKSYLSITVDFSTDSSDLVVSVLSVSEALTTGKNYLTAMMLIRMNLSFILQ